MDDVLFVIIASNCGIIQRIRQSWATQVPSSNIAMYSPYHCGNDSIYLPRNFKIDNTKCCKNNPFFCAKHRSAVLKYQSYYVDVAKHVSNHIIQKKNKWIAFLDDDTWVNPIRLNMLLTKYNNKRLLHIAHYIKHSKHHPKYKTFCGGAGHLFTYNSFKIINWSIPLNQSCKQSDWTISEYIQMFPAIERIDKEGCKMCGSLVKNRGILMKYNKCLLAQRTNTDLRPYSYNTLAFVHDKYFPVGCGGKLSKKEHIHTLLPGPIHTGTTIMWTLLKSNGFVQSSLSSTKNTHYFDYICLKKNVSYYVNSFQFNKTMTMDVTSSYFTILHRILYSNVEFRRVIIILRHPTQRLLSIYEHIIRATRNKCNKTKHNLCNIIGKLALETAKKNRYTKYSKFWNQHFMKNTHPSLKKCVENGLYAPYIRGWRNAFPKRLHLLNFHKLFGDKIYQQKTLAKLGLSGEMPMYKMNTGFYDVSDIAANITNFYAESLDILCRDEKSMCPMTSMSLPAILSGV